ncbi:hypothetical protein BXZ70DRAFT_895336, partial [Cristinia sonorae]
MSSRNPTQYKERRLLTGIVKPSIFSGLPLITQVPSCFVLDGMHLILNLADIFMALWRGTLYVEGQDSRSYWDWAVFQDSAVWKKHGAVVGASRPYFPGSFDRPPRNPAEKINSGYKA